MRWLLEVQPHENGIGYRCTVKRWNDEQQDYVVHTAADAGTEYDAVILGAKYLRLISQLKD